MKVGMEDRVKEMRGGVEDGVKGDEGRGAKCGLTLRRHNSNKM